MGIESERQRLRGQLAALQEGLEVLGTTIDEDRPRRRDVAVAGYLADAVLAARGVLEDAVLALQGPPLDDAATRAALANSHRAFLRYGQQFGAEVASFERIDDLASVARERGREWADWVGVVRQEIEQCRHQAEQAAAVFVDCWQELADRTATVSVRNSVVGQQMRVPGVGPAYEGTA